MEHLRSSGCLTPRSIRKKESNDTAIVPCGNCPTCVARAVSSWSFRLIQESKRSISAIWMRLSYDTDHVPITSKGFMSFPSKEDGGRARDLQLFMKRLRKLHTWLDGNYPTWEPGKKGFVQFIRPPIKYFAVGEYGEKKERPHYHMHLFNANQCLIQAAWKKGDIYYGTVEGASIGYTLKYMSKPGKIPKHKNDDRQKEFRVMSKGIGDNYLTKNMIAWHKADMENRMYLNIEDGKKISMPRYYKDKLYTTAERGVLKGIFQEKAEQIAINAKKITPARTAAESVKARFRKSNYSRNKGSY